MMKIVHLAAGAGEMYCGTCLQENTLAAELRAQGEDVTLVPLYMPLKTDEEDVSVGRVAFGGINVYLQQRFALFRHTPWLLDRFFDRPGLLRFAARHSRGTRPEGLGPLTVSMLRGERGRQRKELDKLAGWLADELRPELVHLSNALLVGMARELAARLGVPIVCTLSGEDEFLERLPEPYRAEARAVLCERAEELAALVAMSRHYAHFMAGYLSVPRDRIHVIPPGLNLVGHAPADGPPPPFPRGETITVGHLGRVCHEKGLHLLVEALGLLRERVEVPSLRVRAGGYLDRSDRPYFDDVLRRAAVLGVDDRFEHLGELDRAGKIALLRSCDLFVAPSLQAESKGLTALEAWANGLPTVLPDHGAFSELVAETGGGVLFEPGNAASLADAIAGLIGKPETAAEHGRLGQAAVHQRYHAAEMARRTVELYRRLLECRCPTSPD